MLKFVRDVCSWHKTLLCGKFALEIRLQNVLSICPCLVLSMSRLHHNCVDAYFHVLRVDDVQASGKVLTGLFSFLQ